MEVELFKIKLKDIDGKKLKPKEGEESKGVHNSVAYILYTLSRNLDLVDIALNMNKGHAVEMAPSHIAEMRILIADPEKGGLLAFARKAVIDYLDDLEEKEKKKKKK